MAPHQRKHKSKLSRHEVNNNVTESKRINSSNDSAKGLGLKSWASGHLFHGYSIHAIVFFVLSTRLNLTGDKTSWWFVHPDESFQATEVAHSEVYGYGFRSLEYFRDVSNSTDIQVQLHQSIGMTGTKSWLPVRFYAAILNLKEFLTIPTSPFQITKTIHTSLAGLLPMSTFLLVRNLEGSYPNDVSCIAAILVGFTDYFVLLGTHTFLESLTSPMVILGIAYFFTIFAKPDDSHNQSKLRHSIISGFLIGLSLFIKPDSVVIIATSLLVLVPLRLSHRVKFVRVIVFLLGLVMAVLFCAYEEHVSYGSPIHSPLRWWTFRSQMSHKVFGTLPKDYYLNYVVNTPIVLAQVVTCLFSFPMAVYIRTTRSGSLIYDCKGTLNLSLSFFVIFVANITFLSYFEHKDVRYLHDAFVMLACSCACAVFVVFRFLRTLLIAENQEKLVVALKLFIYAEALMCVIRSSAGYPSAKNHIIRDPVLVPQNFWESSEVSAACDFVSRQNDVTGLVLDFSIHRASGYAGFHKNVPIIAKTFQDFREWTAQSGRVVDRVTSVTPLGSKSAPKITVHSFDDVSNFHAEENGLLVLKHVIDKPSYNYAILTRNRKFPQVGFKPVFRAGNTTVFKRIKSKKARVELSQIGVKLEAKNASILEYEARWLVSLGLKTLALQRIELALKLEPKCAACWQILHHLSDLDFNDPKGQKQRAKDGCFKHVGPETCGSRIKMTKIHEQYSLGVLKVFNPEPII